MMYGSRMQQTILTLNGAASLQVYDTQGHPLTGIVPQPGPLTLGLSTTGNYGIAVHGVGQVTLNVTIPPLPSAPTPQPTVPLPVSRSPISFPPGNASTTFTTTLAAGVPQGYMLRVLQSQTMYVSVSENVSVGVLGPGDVALAITRTGWPGLWTVRIPGTGNYTMVLYGIGQASVTIYIPPL